MAKKYSEKLKDPRWQKKRLKILERDDWTCQFCGETESTLHIHHLVYIQGNDPWDYKDDFLLTLCVDCHEVDHESRGLYEGALLKILKYNKLDCNAVFRLALDFHLLMEDNDLDAVSALEAFEKKFNIGLKGRRVKELLPPEINPHPNLI